MGLLLETTSPKLEVGTATSGTLNTKITNDSLVSATFTLAATPAGAGLASWSLTAAGSVGVTGLPVGAQTGNISATVVVPANGFVIITGTVVFPALTKPAAAYTIGFTVTPASANPMDTYVTFIQGDPVKQRISRRAGLAVNPLEVERRFFEGAWDTIEGQKALDVLQNEDSDLAKMILKLRTL